MITSTKEVSPTALTFMREQIARFPEEFKQKADSALNDPDIWNIVHPQEGPVEEVFPKKPDETPDYSKMPDLGGDVPF